MKIVLNITNWQFLESKTKYLVVPVDQDSCNNLYKDWEFVHRINMHDLGHSRMKSADDIEFAFKNQNVKKTKAQLFCIICLRLQKKYKDS